MSSGRKVCFFVAASLAIGVSMVFVGCFMGPSSHSVELSNSSVATERLLNLTTVSPTFADGCREVNQQFYNYFLGLMWLRKDTGRWNIVGDRGGPTDERRWEEVAKAATYSEYNVSQLPLSSFCQRRVVFPLTTNFLLRQLRGKKLLFLGDSIARNHYVLTMARLCNHPNIDKCHTRMPTYEYDIDQDDMTIRGPMGCVPKGSSGTSPCYRDGNFSYVPIAGLTLKELSVKKKALRRKAVKGGFIPPAMVMTLPLHNITLIYLSVIRPQAIEKVAMHMLRRRSILSDVDGILVSVGPHMSSFEMSYLNVTFPRAMTTLRAATASPVVIAEMTHHLEEAGNYSAFIDDMIHKTRELLDQLPNPPLVVPQRHVTANKFRLQSPVLSVSEEMGVQKGCGYYDKQHPAVRCNLVLSELMIGALLGKMIRGPS